MIPQGNHSAPTRRRLGTCRYDQTQIKAFCKFSCEVVLCNISYVINTTHLEQERTRHYMRVVAELYDSYSSGKTGNLNLGSEFRGEPPNTKVSGTVYYPRFHIQGNGNDAIVLVGLPAMFKSDYDNCGCFMRPRSVPYKTRSALLQSFWVQLQVLIRCLHHFCKRTNTRNV